MKENKKLSPDIVLKKYWENKERFADLFNAVLFDGEHIIKKEDLEELPTEVSNIIEGSEESLTIPRLRDIVMQYRGVALSVLCIENESKIHYAMPLRKMLYDSLSYQKQCDNIARGHKRKKDLKSKEFLSFMTKEDRLCPVITIVVYYGKKAWNGAKSLYEMLNIPENMKPFVNDYKINLVEIRENNLKLNDDDNNLLFEYINIMYNKNYTTKEKKLKLLENDKSKHINKEVLMTLAAATNTFDRSYYKKIIENKNAKGDVAMDNFFDELFEEGKEKGREEGRMEGQAKQIIRMSIKYNVAKENIITELITELNISDNKAKEYYDEYSSFE